VEKCPTLEPAISRASCRFQSPITIRRRRRSSILNYSKQPNFRCSQQAR